MFYLNFSGDDSSDEFGPFERVLISKLSVSAQGEGENQVLASVSGNGFEIEGKVYSSCVVSVKAGE